MKAKAFFSYLLLFALLASCLAFSAAAEEAPQGKYEVKGTFTSNGAQIFDDWYDSMDQLWDELGSMAGAYRLTEIKLYADWDLYEEKTFDFYSCDVVLDLNGHSIIRHTQNSKQEKNGGVIRVASNARLTIVDSDPASAGYDGIRGGVITGGASTNGGGAFTLTENGKLTIAGGTVYKCTTNEHGGAVMLTGSDKQHPRFEMTGGRLYFCQTTGAWANSHGGAIYADNGDVVLSGCSIDSCYSEDNGGAVYMNSGSLNVRDARLTANHCLDYGGAIFISGGSLLVSRSRFSTNEAKQDGGAVYVDAEDGARFRDCVFTRNQSFGSGGAIYVNDDCTFLIDTDVIANSAAGYGGGVYVDSMDDVGVKGLVRIYNNSGKSGRNNLTLQDGFTSRAYLSDGGLYEGSSIGLSSTGANVKYADDISVYQAGYFFSDRGELAFGETFQREAPMLASTFTQGGYPGLVIGLSLFLLCGAATYAVLTKKKQRMEERNR